ncbi:MAG TPA: fumarate hydratase, partial [Candidatus Handelsmanbacteria bacterium]|nr:fumarate hydratase [Candidatus Handelsmanbacteria bacterium]
MNDYVHHELLPLGKDETPYRLLTTDHVSVVEFEGREILKVAPEGLTLLADQAIRDSAHLLRPSHLAQVRKILDDPEASDNDRFVALDMLKNANIAAGWILPMCQDTGTAIVMGKKGHQVWTDGNDEAAISAGIAKAYNETNLRYSQLAPLSMFEEQNTRTNLPAQIELFADQGDTYKLMFMAKGGGSANKSYLFQETRALLNPEKLRSFIDEKLRMIGTAACPP